MTTAPEIKTVPAITFLCAKRELTLPEIPAFAETALPPLVAAAEANGLQVLGPEQFIYHGIDGGEIPRVMLEIGLPVDRECALNGDQYFKRTDEFSCVALNYVGPMTTIGTGWTKLHEEIRSQGRTPTDECREIYHTWVGFDSEENVTELQQGIAEK